MSSTEPNPVLVEFSRGPLVESRHRGAVAVAFADGRLKYACGDIDSPVFARSALKPLQAIPLLETGAADACGASDAQLALACASHSGEHCHHDLAERWLQGLGLAESDLACGPAAPLGERASVAFHRVGKAPAKLYHNCSGKHVGMLAVCCHQGESIHDYQDHFHPSQQRWLGVLGDMCDLDGRGLPWDYDGCGLTAPATPLRALAKGLARLADPVGLMTARQQACERIHYAMTTHSQLVAGEGRACSLVMRALAGKVSVKTGAEGVFAGVVPSLGLGFALKMDDGAGRAAEVVLGAVLQQLGLLDAQSAAELQPVFRPELRNSRSQCTGAGYPAATFLEDWA